MSSINLEGIKLSWRELIEPIWNEHKDRIISYLSKEDKFYPPADNVFECFKYFEVSELKVIILGMDPYINEGEAHGLAFSVKYGKKMPPSLNNIFKELYREYGIQRTHKDLTDWAEQGVLLLNTALTVRAGSSGSHIKIWEPFMNDLISCIGSRSSNIVCMLWGKNAQKFEFCFNNNIVLKHTHPSPLSRKPFVGNGHFSECDKHFETALLKWV